MHFEAARPAQIESQNGSDQKGKNPRIIRAPRAVSISPQRLLPPAAFLLDDSLKEIERERRFLKWAVSILREGRVVWKALIEPCYGISFGVAEPLENHGWEWRCYMRDPDGYLIEVGQYTQRALDHFKKDVKLFPNAGV